MRKVLFLVLAGFLLYSCTKDDGCQPVSVDSERSQLVNYCNINGIKYTIHPAGFLYQIVDSGTGVAPTINSTIQCNYVGKHLDNSVFDSSATPYKNVLANLIDGWKLGLPLIKKGGRLKLVLPSALGYSCTGSKASNGIFVITPNEPIFFDLTLLDVQ